MADQSSQRSKRLQDRNAKKEKSEKAEAQEPPTKKHKKNASAPKKKAEPVKKTAGGQKRKQKTAAGSNKATKRARKGAAADGAEVPEATTSEPGGDERQHESGPQDEQGRHDQRDQQDQYGQDTSARYQDAEVQTDRGTTADAEVQTNQGTTADGGMNVSQGPLAAPFPDLMRSPRDGVPPAGEDLVTPTRWEFSLYGPTALNVWTPRQAAIASPLASIQAVALSQPAVQRCTRFTRDHYAFFRDPHRDDEARRFLMIRFQEFLVPGHTAAMSTYGRTELDENFNNFRLDWLGDRDGLLAAPQVGASRPTMRVLRATTGTRQQSYWFVEITPDFITENYPLMVNHVRFPTNIQERFVIGPLPRFSVFETRHRSYFIWTEANGFSHEAVPGPDHALWHRYQEEHRLFLEGPPGEPAPGESDSQSSNSRSEDQHQSGDESKEKESGSGDGQDGDQQDHGDKKSPAQGPSKPNGHEKDDFGAAGGPQDQSYTKGSHAGTEDGKADGDAAGEDEHSSQSSLPDYQDDEADDQTHSGKDEEDTRTPVTPPLPPIASLPHDDVDPCEYFHANLALWTQAATQDTSAHTLNRLTNRTQLTDSAVLRAIACVTEAIRCASGHQYALIDMGTFRFGRSTGQMARQGADLLFPWTQKGHHALWHVRLTPSSEMHEDAQIFIHDSAPYHWRNTGIRDSIENNIQQRIRQLGWIPNTSAEAPARFHTERVTVGRQINETACGLHVILNAWCIALGLQLRSNEQMTEAFYIQVLEVVNLAVQGHMDAATINAFLSCFGYIHRDSRVPAGRLFRSTMPFLTDHAFELYQQRRTEFELQKQIEPNLPDTPKLRELLLAYNVEDAMELDPIELLERWKIVLESLKTPSPFVSPTLPSPSSPTSPTLLYSVLSAFGLEDDVKDRDPDSQRAVYLEYYPNIRGIMEKAENKERLRLKTLWNEKRMEMKASQVQPPVATEDTSASLTGNDPASIEGVGLGIHGLEDFPVLPGLEPPVATESSTANATQPEQALQTNYEGLDEAGIATDAGGSFVVDDLFEGEEDDEFDDLFGSE